MFQIKLYDMKKDSPNASITTNINFHTQIPTSFIGNNNDVKAYQKALKELIKKCEDSYYSEVAINDYYRILDAVDFIIHNKGKLFYVLLQNNTTYQSLILNAHIPFNNPK